MCAMKARLKRSPPCEDLSHLMSEGVRFDEERNTNGKTKKIKKMEVVGMGTTSSSPRCPADFVSAIELQQQQQQHHQMPGLNSQLSASTVAANAIALQREAAAILLQQADQELLFYAGIFDRPQQKKRSPPDPFSDQDKLGSHHLVLNQNTVMGPASAMLASNSPAGEFFHTPATSALEKILQEDPDSSFPPNRSGSLGQVCEEDLTRDGLLSGFDSTIMAANSPRLQQRQPVPPTGELGTGVSSLRRSSRGRRLSSHPSSSRRYQQHSSLLASSLSRMSQPESRMAAFSQSPTSAFANATPAIPFHDSMRHITREMARI